MEIRIVDGDRRPIAPGESGEIEVRGAVVMSGYLNRPDLTAEVLAADGWFATGDLGRIDDDGALTVLDRKKDMIISGGENIYPGELEASLSELPGVQQVAVVGIADDLWGQAVCAVVVRSDRTLTENQVVQWCRERHAPYKSPRRVVFVEDLPLNAVGKVVKRTLIDTIERLP
jgi:acyl-CoA synthetase (AMP-forming)/AMP-acid ligase II